MREEKGMTSSGSREREIAIVGVAESDEMGTVPNKSSLQHHAEAAHNALADAGLSKSDVDGVLPPDFPRWPLPSTWASNPDLPTTRR